MIELSVVPDNWKLTTIIELADVIMGQSPPSNTYNSEKIGLPFFQGKAEFTDLHPAVRKWCSEPNKVSLPDDILLSVRAPVGAVNMANVECCIGRGLAAIRYEHCNKFLFYFFKFIEKKLDEKGTGTTFRAISGETLKSVSLPLPPLPEQHRIVAKIEALFSELDKGIESLKTAQQQLKIYRQALLKHAFSGKLTEQWRAENQDKLETAEALLQRIQTEREQRYQAQLKEWETNGKQGTKPKAPKVLPPLTDEELAELPELPSGWGYSRLGHLIDEPTYGTSKKCDYETDGIGVLRIPNVVSGKIDASDLKFAQFNNDEIASYKLSAGDILLIRSNGSISIVGRCALVSNQDVKYLYAGYLIMLRPNKRMVLSAHQPFQGVLT